jgi:hypothetical protein
MSNVTTLSTKELIAPSSEVRGLRDALDVDVKRVIAQTKAIKEVMTHAMVDGTHYGVIPGTDKPTLYQAGADKLCMLFRLRPRYRTKILAERDFISVQSICRLYHIDTGLEWGEGQGWANSREEKYLSQSITRVCPTCKKAAILRSKFEDRDGAKGWYCNLQKGGCNSQFKAKDPAIEGQGDLVIGDKVWNLANTILKISNKRSKVAGVLTATGAADLFTQDLEDLDEAEKWLDGRTEQPPALGATNGKSAQPPAGSTNGNGAPANGSPPPAANGTTNGNGTKRGGAGPLQIRDLTTALRGKLQATEPERQMAWVNGMLPKGRVVTAFTELTPDEAAMLAKAAENGEVPGGAEK